MGKIQAKDLVYRYEDGFCALQGLNFTIDDGEFVCIIGHSGCGKSTLLSLISGLTEISDGELLFDGQPIEGPGLDRAVVFQQYSLFPWQRAKRNVEFGIKQAHPELTKEQISARADKALADVGMSHAADRFPFQLSGGMKQRVAIARALALDSDTLLLDEPFGALDQKRRTQLQRLLLDLWDRGEHRKTVVFVTHDIDEAILLADRVLFMRPGEITEDVHIDLPRPRVADELATDAHYLEIKQHLLDLFSLDEETEGDEHEIRA